MDAPEESNKGNKNKVKVIRPCIKGGNSPGAPFSASWSLGTCQARGAGCWRAGVCDPGGLVAVWPSAAFWGSASSAGELIDCREGDESGMEEEGRWMIRDNARVCGPVGLVAACPSAASWGSACAQWDGDLADWLIGYA